MLIGVPVLVKCVGGYVSFCNTLVTSIFRYFVYGTYGTFVCPPCCWYYHHQYCLLLLVMLMLILLRNIFSQIVIAKDRLANTFMSAAPKTNSIYVRASLRNGGRTSVVVHFN